jgi:D-alanyl-D-alanine carboxypeptidase/D-alanyl-D-alanine-endopeptidase (penicillin-binding protein 4)
VGNYYAAGVSGLNFHENMYFVYFNAGKKLGYPATVVRTVPKNIDIHGASEVTTAGENTGDQVIVYGSPTGKERIYRGTVPLGKKDFAVRAAMPNPAKTCADLFSSYLRTHGVGVSSNSMQVYTVPDSLRLVLDYRSSSYYTIAQYTNLTSNNIYAESIFKYLGYHKYGLGSFQNGAKTVAEWLKGKGLAAEGVRVVDGSGLSRLNRVTTDFLCRYLTAMSKESFFDEFMQTIAKAGENGTAKNLLPGLPAGITVHVKTGTMDGVKSYAGYVLTPHGQTLAFAIVSNNHDASAADVGGKLNKILYKIATMY